ncbi:MAG: hypothetical protein DMG51_15705 [Acidobacteria bacterium]|nr:MAG: hypothetical protein DMG51_15705 [Acidobacteriota bacterium]
MRGAGTYIFQYVSLFLLVPELATSKKTGAYIWMVGKQEAGQTEFWQAGRITTKKPACRK